MNICVPKPIALGLLGGSLLCAMPTNHTAFATSLTLAQARTWTRVQSERFYIYMVSLAVSLAVARSIRAHPWQRVLCMMLLVASLYIVFPKSTYMRHHITNEQDRLLQDVYKRQRVRYHGSVVLAIMATPLTC